MYDGMFLLRCRESSVHSSRAIKFGLRDLQVAIANCTASIGNVFLVYVLIFGLLISIFGQEIDQEREL